MTAFLPLALALSVTQAPAPANPPAATPAAPAQAAPAPAAPPPATGPTLTLDDVLRLAAERNYDLKAAAARLRQAEQGYWKALSGQLPQITLGGTYTHYNTGVVFPFALSQDPTTNKVTFVDVSVLPQDQLQGTVDASLVLFSPALWYGVQAASRGEDSARASTENARRAVLFGAAQAYYGVASLRRLTEVSQQLLEIAQRQEKDAKVRYQAGTIAKVGLLRAEIDRARAEQDLQRARNSYQSARLALAALIEQPASFEVVDPEEPKLPPDPSKLPEAALRDRADVKAARSALESAVSNQRSQYASYLPSLAAFGHYQNANVPGLTGAELWSVGLSAQWKFDGGLREASIREASAKRTEAEANLAGAETRAKLEVGQALLDLDSARANAQKAKEQRDLAAENQRLVDVSYRAGSATAVEQADATAQLRNAEIAQTTETLNAQLAALRVLQAAGADIR